MVWHLDFLNFIFFADEHFQINSPILSKIGVSCAGISWCSCWCSISSYGDCLCAIQCGSCRKNSFKNYSNVIFLNLGCVLSLCGGRGCPVSGMELWYALNPGSAKSKTAYSWTKPLHMLILNLYFSLTQFSFFFFNLALNWKKSLKQRNVAPGLINYIYS